tara:strand:- start:4163 stop:4669 length:507 start_codon:yes stop_codon:yes gene_type:complete
MLELNAATPGIIFASIIFNSKHSLEDIQSIWSEKLDLAEMYWPEFNPSIEYYSKEMGNDLKRVIFFSSNKVPREEMINLKLWATEKERLSSNDNKRSLNIDIGLMCLEQVLLSTSKPYSHRIYLNHGVYAELTYKYENKSYHFLPWTYPDYQHQEKVDFFNSMRSRLF